MAAHRKCLVLVLVLIGSGACGAQTVDREDGDDSTSSDSNSADVDSNGHFTLGGDLRRHEGPAVGGAGGTGVQLPPFDCSDPRFFPLRVDEEGHVLENENLGGSGFVETNTMEEGSGDLTVLLVFDKSGSMGSPWGGKSRWQAGSDAFLLGLDGILDVVTIGAVLFPFEEGAELDQCGVEPIESPIQIDFRSGRGFKSRWTEMACRAQPEGNTPLEKALGVADDAIVHATERGLTDERFRVVLVTDGAPTCDDIKENILFFPQKWKEQGIETHVIGLPGSGSAADLLDAIARAGGSTEHRAPQQLGAFEKEVYDLLR